MPGVVCVAEGLLVARKLAQQIADIGRCGRFEPVAADRGDRGRRGEAGALDARAGDDDFLIGSGLGLIFLRGLILRMSCGGRDGHGGCHGHERGSALENPNPTMKRQHFHSSPFDPLFAVCETSTDFAAECAV